MKQVAIRLRLRESTVVFIQEWLFKGYSYDLISRCNGNVSYWKIQYIQERMSLIFWSNHHG